MQGKNKFPWRRSGRTDVGVDHSKRRPPPSIAVDFERALDEWAGLTIFFGS